METYKITWFNSKKQRIEDKIFNCFEDAVKWGKKTLTNFNSDLIQTVFN